MNTKGMKKRQAKLSQRKARRAARRILIGNPIRNYYVYTLLLEEDCYYVGVTAYKDAVRRFEQHCAGTGSNWTRLHKPISILEVKNVGYCKQSSACLIENEVTRECIKTYGIENVRGGDLCYLDIKTVQKHLNTRSENKQVNKAERAKAKQAKLELEYQEQLARELAWIVQ